MQASTVILCLFIIILIGCGITLLWWGNHLNSRITTTSCKSGTYWNGTDCVTGSNGAFCSSESDCAKDEICFNYTCTSISSCKSVGSVVEKSECCTTGLKRFCMLSDKSIKEICVTPQDDKCPSDAEEIIVGSCSSLLITTKSDTISSPLYLSLFGPSKVFVSSKVSSICWESLSAAFTDDVKPYFPTLVNFQLRGIGFINFNAGSTGYFTAAIQPNVPYVSTQSYYSECATTNSNAYTDTALCGLYELISDSVDVIGHSSYYIYLHNQSIPQGGFLLVQESEIGLLTETEVTSQTKTPTLFNIARNQSGDFTTMCQTNVRKRSCMVAVSACPP